MNINFQISIYLCLMLAVSLPACAQDKNPSKDFKVIYDITIPDSDDMGMMSAFLPTESISYVKGNQSRTELSMGMGMNTSIINNAKTNETINLISFMGKKYAVDMSNGTSEVADQKSNVVLVDETKNILGYNCKKAEISIIHEGKTYTTTAWYTPQIKNKAVTLSGKTFQELDGLLMEFELENNGLKMKMLAKRIEFKDIDPAIFLVPKDHKVVTMEELGKLLGEFH